MAPPSSHSDSSSSSSSISSQPGTIYRDLIQSNCQTYLGPRAELDVVSQLDATGTLWTVHVLQVSDRGKRREPVLSGSAATLQAALEELHKKSAQAVDQHVARNGFAAGSSASKKKSSPSSSASRRSSSNNNNNNNNNKPSYKRSRARRGLRRSSSSSDVVDLGDSDGSSSDSDASTASFCSSRSGSGSDTSGSSGSLGSIVDWNPPKPKTRTQHGPGAGVPFPHGGLYRPHHLSLQSRHPAPAPWPSSSLGPGNIGPGNIAPGRMPAPGPHAGARLPPGIVTQPPSAEVVYPPPASQHTRPTPGINAPPPPPPPPARMPMAPPPIPGKPPLQLHFSRQKRLLHPVVAVQPPSGVPGVGPPSLPKPKRTLVLTVEWESHGVATFVESCRPTADAVRDKVRAILLTKSDQFASARLRGPLRPDEVDRLDVTIKQIQVDGRIVNLWQTIGVLDDVSYYLDPERTSKNGSSDIAHVVVEVADPLVWDT
ncbi:pyruvate dehydrogenase E1 component alpha subunit [Purpureocillium lavendulum]|uniref:Pyruvate dehydrogenase E1 component alpha subunit n=1 Tax=Purpureocillium lavendulum TaxID=1247861 RepID=A0AB34G012_9HYPO|nr:pyruvate dehydrogenase E1 component alpha subunit [Purpureocillium lavendulum]